MGSVYSSSVVAVDSQNGVPSRSKPLLLPHPKVETAKGTIEGFRHQLVDGRPVNVFLGIPFAKPPIGQLRFKKPIEPDEWHPRILMAKKYRQRSIQMNFLHTDIAERRAGKSEDCLYLNVIAPGWSAKNEEGAGRGFPVMFYIHGGAYLIDSAVKYNYRRLARSLAHHGVIVVIVQYRLGLLGFFSTGDTVCPGNFGLWDQLMALQWTKQTIAAFGGDPSRITVFGQSAGAACADLLGICPISRDLFTQSILMGGNAECCWALLEKQQIVEYCRKWAQKMGFKTEKPLEGNWSLEENRRMMEFLGKLPAGKFEINLIGAMGAMFENMRLPVGPVIDGELVPNSPKQLRKECQTSRKTIVGICKNEGMLFLALAMKRANGKLLAKFEKQMEKLMEEAKKKEGNIPMIEKSLLLPKFYGFTETMRTNKQMIEKTCVTLLSDFASNIGLHNFCEHSLANGPIDPSCTIFRYQFDHFNPNNTRALNPLMPLKGPTHATELAFIFDVNMFVLPWSRTKADKRVLSIVTKMWTNFAKFGDPNGKMKSSQYTESDLNQNGNRNGQIGQQDNSAFPFRWAPIDEENIGRHLCISDELTMQEGAGNDGKRIQMLADAYRALIQ